MGGLLGPMGGLRELRCASDLSEEYVRGNTRSITEDADGGEHAQLYDVRPNRQWTVAAGTATPWEMAELTQLSLRQLRSGPLTYYSESAQVQNVLDPSAALMDVEWWHNILPGGARVLPDGLGLPGPRFEVSGGCQMDGSWAQLDGIHVPENRDVTVSVYVSAYAGRTATVRVDELGYDRRELRMHQASTDGVLVRMPFQFKTLGETTQLRLSVRDAVTVVAPQVTITRGLPAGWAEGAGSQAVLLSAPPARQAQLALPDVSWGVRSSYSWQIREIGRNGIG